jgi:ubiquinone/menaquinone biosynthesis C-methylase UbiE/DNA-directed RNA polymerase subunit RPC12/RpoP
MKMENIFICPHCHAEVQWSIEHQSYDCPRCQKKFPVKDGYIDFYPEYQAAPNFGQRTMEANSIINIYETDKFRGSKIMTLGFHISLDQELALINQIAQPGSADMILDLASGPGLFARMFAQKDQDRSVFAFDLSRQMLSWGSQKAVAEHLGNLAFIHGDAHRLPFKNETFDVVNATGAIHNFANVHKAFAETSRVMKPGGRFTFSVALNRKTFYTRAASRFYQTFFSVHFFTVEELSFRLREAGFEPTIYHAQGVWMIGVGIKSD